MAGKITYNCAVCEIEKKAVNGWYLVWVLAASGVAEYSLRGWNDEIAREDEDVLPVCGRAHAHVLLDTFFSHKEPLSSSAPSASECPPESVPPTSACSSSALFPAAGAHPQPLDTTADVALCLECDLDSACMSEASSSPAHSLRLSAFLSRPDPPPAVQLPESGQATPDSSSDYPRPYQSDAAAGSESGSDQNAASAP